MADLYKQQLDEANETIKRHEQLHEKHRKIRMWLIIEMILALGLVVTSATWFIHIDINQSKNEPTDYTVALLPQVIVLTLICIVRIIRLRIQRKD